ncbi:hypothetical protein B4096_2086 [Heyndrickxia coagulans]|uniref:Uncharacterized protein n=2 Tax=Heyndrickxia coagulans TaxID=1398 RepID=G2TMX2_HEYCO|nr:hypothetical protein Bcoa_2011 [Heyndrickxia coagulans 36D1]AJO21637.1 hypothetical protein SB48_HM08orf01293 [Heyndrickxia coagulans]KYC77010.1 hypothetical protein B4096_2086 [Heyndrickxia coagulans]
MNDITSISKIKYALKLQILAGCLFLQFWERMRPSGTLAAWKTTMSYESHLKLSTILKL